MSTNVNGEEMYSIGARLKEERLRLGLSQEGLGSRLATTGRTIKKYEGDETSIRATELLQLSGMGADVFYIVTGERYAEGVAQTRVPYTVAEHLGKFIADLKLTAEDAGLLKAMALRMTK